MTETKPTWIYRVTLTDQERPDLDRMTRTGKAVAKLAKARVLLLADEEEGPEWSDRRIVEAVGLGMTKVCRVRERIVEEGMEAAVNRRPPDRVYARKLGGRAEPQLVKLACSKPPQGRAAWTLRLLTDQMVVLGHVDTVSSEMGGRREKKLN